MEPCKLEEHEEGKMLDTVWQKEDRPKMVPVYREKCFRQR
jgi:hypothetical protein